MKKTIFERMCGIYIRQGDYLIPSLALPEEEQRYIDVWGERPLRYLKICLKAVYLNLLTNGRLRQKKENRLRQKKEKAY